MHMAYLLVHTGSMYDTDNKNIMIQSYKCEVCCLACCELNVDWYRSSELTDTAETGDSEEGTVGDEPLRCDWVEELVCIGGAEFGCVEYLTGGGPTCNAVCADTISTCGEKNPHTTHVKP